MNRVKKERFDLDNTTTEGIEPMVPKRIVDIEPKVGLYLVKPHAEMIVSGEKTLIVKSKKFTSHINEPLYLLEGKLCYGIIVLQAPTEITPKQFEESRERHQISDEDAFEHWGWKKEGPLYAYEFTVQEKYDPPKPVKIPQGIQVFVYAKNIKFLDLKTLTVLDLFDYADILSEDLYAEIVEELFDRNFFKSQVFELIRGWISDYDINKPNDKQLGDDYRITLGWYSSIKKGKKLFKRVGEEKKEITLEDCKELGLKIFKEMVKRGFTFNKPETYKKNARELYEWIISQVGEKNVPFKGKEKEEKAELVPSEIKREDLEKIDPVYIKTLTDNQLAALDSRLHEIFKEIGKVTEPLENAHIFVWSEMRHRNIKHTIDDELTRKSSLEVEEYPMPEEGLPQQISNEEMAKLVKLEEVLAAFPDTITVGEPIHVYLCGRVVNEKTIPLSHDLDLLFKQGWLHEPTMKAFLEQVASNNPEVAKKFHFVWDVEGPQIGFTVPLYRLAFLRVGAEEMKRSSPFEFLAGAQPQLFKPHIGIKPRSGFEKYEFWDPQELWDKWAKKFIDRGIVVQKKYDGMRFQIHCKGKEIKIFTEDRQRDRANVFKKSVEEILQKKKADSFIIDAEMVEYGCGKIETKNFEEVCEPLPREGMIKWIAAGESKLDDEFIVFHVHDCVFLNGEVINGKGYEERWAAIDKIFSGLAHWKKVPGEKAEDMREFFKLVKKYRSMKGSEGVVCKAADSTYKIKFSGEARSEEWAKLKNLKEIDVMVDKVIQKKTKEGKALDQYLYECVFSVSCAGIEKYREKDVVRQGGKCYLFIGRSYATGEKVSSGTIIVVRPIRIGEYEDNKGKIYYTWMFPYYSGKHASKTEPDGLDVVKKLVAASTGPTKLSLGKMVFNLSQCPFWADEKVCPLKERFREPRDELSKVQVEHLKFPILCKFANHYKCRFVKKYYYGYKTFEVDSVTDEDDLTIKGEED